MASRLEAATKQYRVPLLMSEAFFTGLSGHVQSTCRRVDRVMFKGSTDPIQIYHVPGASDWSNNPVSNHSELVAMTSWDEDTENDYRAYRALFQEESSANAATKKLQEKHRLALLFVKFDIFHRTNRHINVDQVKQLIRSDLAKESNCALPALFSALLQKDTPNASTRVMTIK
eukprot:scaffold893_cov110-Skeletonema_dohrnii-CCMP3373.AAC.5